jgi:hypothetical protein
VVADSVRSITRRQLVGVFFAGLLMAAGLSVELCGGAATAHFHDAGQHVAVVEGPVGHHPCSPGGRTEFVDHLSVRSTVRVPGSEGSGLGALWASALVEATAVARRVGTAVAGGPGLAAVSGVRRLLDLCVSRT